MKSLFYFLFFLTLFAWTGELKNSATVAFIKHKNSMVVQATINGQGPFSFVLDTGASITVISPNAARKLGIAPTGEQLLIKGVGAGSSVGNMCRLNELALGNARVRNFSAVIHPIPHLNNAGMVGLLGHDFLERFNLSFNNRKKLLTLSLPFDKPPSHELTPLERDIRDVLADPSSPFKALNQTTKQLDAVYQNPTTDSLEENCQSIKKDLDATEARVGMLYRHLLNTPNQGDSPETNNNIQKFLYCYTGFKTFLEAAKDLTNALTAQEEGVLNKAWQTYETIKRGSESCWR